MRQRVLAWFVGLVMVPGATVFAEQSLPGEPTVLVGVGAARYDGGNAATASVILSVDAANGLGVTFDRSTRRQGANRKDSLALDYRRIVHRTLGGDLAATIGAAITSSESRRFRTELVGSRFVTVPYFDSNHTLSVSPGVEGTWRVTRYARLRASVHAEFSVRGVPFRFGLGAVVPIGRVTTLPTSDFAVLSLPGVVPGQVVWVRMSDGSDVRGEAVALRNGQLSLKTLRGMTAVAFGDVRRIQTTDGLRDGIVRGLGIGALSGALLFGLSFREGDDHEAAWMVGGMLGLGLGAMAGLIGDSLHEGRRLLYSAPGAGAALRVSPLVTRRGGGVATSVSW
jgi:hypothetical protein